MCTRIVHRVLIAYLLAGAPAVSRAQSSTSARPFSVSVEYVAPAGCPSAAEFAAVVVGRLGYDPFAEDAPQRVLVGIKPGARGLEGRLEWRHADGSWAGEQAFPEHTNDCADLVRAMGFALAVQINLLTTGPASATAVESSPPKDERRPNAPSTASAATAPEGPKRDAATEDRAGGGGDDARRGARWVFGLGAGAALGAGLWPNPVALGRGFGRLARDPLAFELGVEVSSLSTGRRDDGAGFTERALLSSVAVCGKQAPWSACLLGKGGILKVSGQRIDVPASPTGAAAQLGLRLGFEQGAGPVFYAGRVEGLVNLVRPVVRLDRVPVWTAPGFAAGVGLDVGVIFQ